MPVIQLNIALQFPDMRSLWNFAQHIPRESLSIYCGERKLICDCTDADVHLALTTYRATVFEEALPNAAV